MVETGKEIAAAMLVVVFREEVVEEREESVSSFHAGYGKALETLGKQKGIEGFAVSEMENVNLKELDYPSQLQLPPEEVVEETVKWLKRKELIGETLTYHDLVETKFVNGGEG